MFGVALGHQLIAIAKGAKTEKLKYGHRGPNHPVKDLKLDRAMAFDGGASTSMNYKNKLEVVSKDDGSLRRFKRV